VARGEVWVPGLVWNRISPIPSRFYDGSLPQEPPTVYVIGSRRRVILISFLTSASMYVIGDKPRTLHRFAEKNQSPSQLQSVYCLNDFFYWACFDLNCLLVDSVFVWVALSFHIFYCLNCDYIFHTVLIRRLGLLHRKLWSLRTWSVGCSLVIYP